jgi:PAS domain S-box-containing protein
MAARLLLHGAISPQRLSAAAAPLLIVRVLQGLIAWVFFNEYFSVPAVRGFWVVQGAFIAYLLLNLLFALRYRRGRVSQLLVVIDGLANLIPLGLPIAASGGRSSPLLLMLPLQSLPYALVFGTPAMAAFLLSATAMVGAIELADRAVLISVVPLGALVHGSFGQVVAFAVVEALIGGPLAALALLRALDGVRTSRERGDRVERDAATAAVANALLNVSEAVSRPTRLDDILRTVVQVARPSVDMDYCGIALWTQESGKYVRAVATGLGESNEVSTGLQIAPEQVPDFEWVRRLGHCAIVPVAESLQVAPDDVPAVLIAPLMSGRTFFGVMEFARRNPRRAFTQRDMRIADGIARQTAVAIERARLIEEGRRLARALESTEEAVLITDARRRITFANTAFMRTLGYRRDEVVGRDAFEIAGELPEPADQFQDMLLRRSWRGETVVHRKDGTPIPIMLNVSLIRDVDGHVFGAVAILDDISEAKRFQEQMQRADRLAAVGEMAAGIAHEINNALAVIFGQTEHDGDRPSDELHAALIKVDAQARRIAEIVRGVLGFARPRPPRSAPVDLSVLTAKTLDLVRHDMARQGVQLELALEDDLPPAQADPQQLQQVLLNLFTNALQAMAGRPNPWLRIEVHGDGNQLAVRVRDRGPGIAPEVLPRIFDPFFSTKAEGSGLGLSVSYAIARAHGGDLQVDSDIGRGTTFTLLLPIAEPEGAALERALLVDDDPEVAEALATMLAREGLHVSHAASAAEGLALLAEQSWDAVFLDVRLPDLSGPDIYRRLEETRPELARRVVFVTGGVWRSESRLRQELPPQPVLPKPCTQDEVRGVLRQLRAHRQAA